MSYTKRYVVSISKGYTEFKPVSAYDNLEKAKERCDQECQDEFVTGGHVTDCETGQKVYTIGNQDPGDELGDPCAGLEE